MSRILNLIIEDRSDCRTSKIDVESFSIQPHVQDPEKALRSAVKDFLSSGTDEVKTALENACGCFIWDDANARVPDNYFEKHGLKRLSHNALNMVVGHDEDLCDETPTVYKVELFIKGTEEDADSLRRCLAQTICDEYELAKVFGVKVNSDGEHNDGER